MEFLVEFTVNLPDGAPPSQVDAQSRGVRHGSAEVLARRAPALDWLNKGVFIGIGARQATGVIYETYLVG